MKKISTLFWLTLLTSHFLSAQTTLIPFGARWHSPDNGYGPGADAELTRGPYLQAGSATAVTLRWRTDTPTDSRIEAGTVKVDQNLKKAMA